MNFRVGEADLALHRTEGGSGLSDPAKSGPVSNATTSFENARVHSKEMRDQFAEQGYINPIRLLSPRECRQFLRSVSCKSALPPLDWEKGSAACSRAFYEIAAHPVLVEIVAALLGEEVMLWGASIQRRRPGSVHPWHSDIELSCAPPGKTLSVWVGLQHTIPDSCLSFIPYSHRFGITLQQARCQAGVAREKATNEDIVQWARERDKRSHLVRAEMINGEAFIFDGQLWHGSHNFSRKTRLALLLQYATPDTTIRIPDLNYLDWPFRHLERPRPPCIMVRGSAKFGANRIVSPPVALNNGSGCKLTSRIYPLLLPLAADGEMGWKPYSIFAGCTADLRWLTCHASALEKDRCPHPPHSHDEEEVLLLLAGEVDLLLPEAPTAGGSQRRRLGPGQFVYYPAHFPHTLETVSEKPANYVMFKWYAGRTHNASPLGFGQFNILDHLADSDAGPGFCPSLVFDGPTAHLRKLHCHTSVLAPSAGYEPHVDAYDVAIIVLEGEVETLGERVGSTSVIFYPAGEPHGMYNPGKTAAKYVVFEFHGSQSGLENGSSRNPSPSLFAKLRDPQRVKRKLRQLLQYCVGV
jgi:quercetin dioxygenase-like cupin family protein